MVKPKSSDPTKPRGKDEGRGKEWRQDGERKSSLRRNPFTNVRSEYDSFQSGPLKPLHNMTLFLELGIEIMGWQSAKTES